MSLNDVRVCDWCKDDKAKDERLFELGQKKVDFSLCPKCRDHFDFLQRENIAPWMVCGHQADEIASVLNVSGGWTPVCSPCRKKGNERSYFVDNKRIAW